VPPAPPEAPAPTRGQRARRPVVLGTALAGVLAAGGLWRTVVSPSSASLTAPLPSRPEATAPAPAGPPAREPSGSASEAAPASPVVSVAPAHPEARPSPLEAGTPAEGSTPPAIAPASVRAPATPAVRAVPARATTASKAARLSVESNLGARAWVDGKPVGSLPLRELELKAGAHRLRVHDAVTGAGREVRLVLKAGQHHVERVVLGQGTLNVLVEPWADVWLGERHLGQTPLAGVALWEGSHRVRLVHPSGTRVVSVSVRPGQTAVLRERLP
jgi:hypothetical protein